MIICGELQDSFRFFQPGDKEVAEAACSVKGKGVKGDARMIEAACSVVKK